MAADGITKDSCTETNVLLCLLIKLCWNVQSLLSQWNPDGPPAWENLSWTWTKWLHHSCFASTIKMTVVFQQQCSSSCPAIPSRWSFSRSTFRSNLEMSTWSSARPSGPIISPLQQQQCSQHLFWRQAVGWVHSTATLRSKLNSHWRQWRRSSHRHTDAQLDVLTRSLSVLKWLAVILTPDRREWIAASSAV